MTESIEYRVVVNTVERGLGVIDVHPPPSQEITDHLYTYLSGQAAAGGEFPKDCVKKPKETMRLEYGRGIRFLIVPRVAPAALKWLGQHAVEELGAQTGIQPDISFGEALEAAGQNSDSYIKKVPKNPYL